jgi:hypothetical protein
MITGFERSTILPPRFSENLLEKRAADVEKLFMKRVFLR